MIALKKWGGIICFKKSRRQKIGKSKLFLAAIVGVIFLLTLGPAARADRPLDKQATLALPGSRSGTDSFNNIHLGGNFIEFGIGQNGSSGKLSGRARLTGFYGRQNSTAGGFLGDADGFGNGADLRIDYFLPGTPAEGWAIYFINGGVTYSGVNSNSSDTIPGYAFSNQSSGNLLRTTGTGLFNSLQIDHDVQFDVNQKFVKYTLTLTNNSATPMTNVAYMRSFDPDNTVDLTGSYTTINTIKADFTAPSDGKVIVEALSQLSDAYYTRAGTQSLIRYYSTDSRAVGRLAGGLMDTNANTVVTGPSAKNTTATADRGISIGFNIGNLNAGAGTSFIFYVAMRSQSGSVTTLMNTDYHFATTDFDYLDPGISLTSASIKSLPANGALYVDTNDNGVVDGGEAVSVDQVLDLTNLALLKFKPNTDWTGATNFNFFSNGISDLITMVINVTPTYTLTFVAGAFGSITGTNPQIIAHGGNSSQMTAVPNTGFHFVNWTGTGGFVTTTNNPLTVTNVTQDRTITANFAINTYTVTATAGPNGSISPPGVTILDYGSSQEYSITPAIGYRIMDVLVDGSSVGAVTTYTFSVVTSSHTITASFSDALVGPTVTTAPVNGLTATSAASGGNVTSDGGAAVTARGVCWSTALNPTTADNHTSDGTGTGTFVSSITGLTANTVYHVRAYATNSVGTSYGDALPFTTTATAPTLTTIIISGITTTTASSGGNVTSDGGAAVTARGVCWSTTLNPTTTDNLTNDGTGTGAFVSSIIGLLPNTAYHVRAYATNSVGTSYGDDLPFTTTATAPTLTTTVISGITTTTASSGGSVTSDGGAAVTARGVCWSMALNPTTTDNLTSDGTGTGSFTSSISGLTVNTTYHVRAYATNSVGTSYGDDLTFTTITIAPKVKTTAVLGLKATSATSGGNVISDGGEAVTIRGVCWSTAVNPTTADNLTSDGTGIGMFTSSITGLTANTTYHVRAYATNSVGTSYGDDIVFTTAENPVLSGRVLMPDGTGVPGVVLSFSNGGGTATTDGSGYYSTIVSYEWSGQSVPVKGGYSFSPVQRTYNEIVTSQSGQDFLVTQSAPRVQILTPKDGANISGSVFVQAEAVDEDGLDSLEIFIDGVSRAKGSSDLCSMTWDTKAAAFGEHVIKAVATDRFGLTASVQIKVRVDNPPIIRIINPAAGANIFGTVNVRAEASDDDRVAKVEFYVNGAKVAERTNEEESVPDVNRPRQSDSRPRRTALRRPAVSSMESSPVPTALKALVLNEEGRLLILGNNEKPVPLTSPGERVLYARHAPDGRLAIVFANSGHLSGETSRGSASMWNPATQTWECLAGAEINVRADFQSSPAVQFDAMGHAYYVITDTGGRDHVRMGEAYSSPGFLLPEGVRLTEWLIKADGGLLFAGRQSASGRMVLQEMTPEGEIREATLPLTMAPAFNETLTGRLFLSLSREDVTVLYEVRRNGGALSLEKILASGFEMTESRILSEHPTERFVETTSGEVFGILSGDGSKNLIQVLPVPRLLSLGSLDRITKIAAMGESLIIAGSLKGQSQIVSYRLSDGLETIIFTGSHEVIGLEDLPDGSILIADRDLEGRRVVIGALDAGEAGSYAYTEIAEIPGDTSLLLGWRTAGLPGFSSGLTLPNQIPSVRSDDPADIQGTSTAAVYDFDLSTLQYPNGPIEIKAVATDSGGQTVSDTITVRVANLQIGLSGRRVEFKAWIIRKWCGEITITTINTAAVPVAKYIVYRSVNDGSPAILQEIPVSSFVYGSFKFEDRYLNQNMRYSYQVVAVDANGMIVGRSNQIEI